MEVFVLYFMLQSSDTIPYFHMRVLAFTLFFYSTGNYFRMQKYSLYGFDIEVHLNTENWQKIIIVVDFYDIRGNS